MTITFKPIGIRKKTTSNTFGIVTECLLVSDEGTSSKKKASRIAASNSLSYSTI
jgi:hypothetical protein